MYGEALAALRREFTLDLTATYSSPLVRIEIVSGETLEVTMKLIVATLAVAVTIAGTAFAAPCKDSKGKFIKCPPVAAASAARCRNAKGAFAKCGSPGAKPA